MIKRGSITKNKKGGFSLVYSNIIFIVLNIIFFSILFLFVQQVSEGKLVYEQAYAKEIVLLIDGAQPATKISLDFEKGIEIAESNGMDFDRIVGINNNQVVISLSEKAGYNFRYFSDYDINHYFEENNLIIIVNEKEDVLNE